jgi:hypothetical protein
MLTDVSFLFIISILPEYVEGSGRVQSLSPPEASKRITSSVELTEYEEEEVEVTPPKVNVKFPLAPASVATTPRVATRTLSEVRLELVPRVK